MSNEIAIIQDKDLELIRDTYCKGATPDEFSLFVQTANRLGLSPVGRQVFAIKRWDSNLRREVMQPMVSIDGLRLVAERSGKYAGQTQPMWCGEDGVWKDVWVKSTPPSAAKVGVLRHDFKDPLYAIAVYSSYCQRNKEGNPMALWGKMPELMLSKCAEALALRKAFPQELSGVYSPDEMGVEEEQQPEKPRQVAHQDAKLELETQAKEMAKEVELCDTQEKLHAVLVRFAPVMAELDKRGKAWHKRMTSIVETKRASFGLAEVQDAEIV